MSAEKFVLPIEVTSQHMDARNHVNNLVYLEWCLASAEAHWVQNTPTAIQKKYIWYVLHHSISYKKAAFEGDLLEVQTWVNTCEGVRSERCYTIIRPKDNALLVEARTLWCLLDAQTQKPVLIPEEIRTLFA